MKIAIDTNIFCADFRMVGSGFRVFLEGLRQIGATCCVPEVVWDEILQKHRQMLQEAASKVAQTNRTWAQLTGQSLVVLPDNARIEAASEEYLEYMRERFRTEGIAILPYPDVSHRYLVTRAVARKRPFRESGAGYRDSLIWASIVSLMRSEKKIAFVTNNTKDFGEAPHLHPDLQADLEDGMTIDLYNTLEQFNANLIVPTLEQLKCVLEQIQEDRFDSFSLVRWVSQNLCDALNDGDFACIFAALEDGHGSVRISKLKACRHVIVDDVRRLPSGDLLLAANADVTLKLSVSADGHDCDRYADVRQFFGGRCSGYVSADLDHDSNIAFTLTIAQDTFEVEDCEIDQIGDPPYVDINPHPGRIR